MAIVRFFHCLRALSCDTRLLRRLNLSLGKDKFDLHVHVSGYAASRRPTRGQGTIFRIAKRKISTDRCFWLDAL
jgi:hypothetical protein